MTTAIETKGLTKDYGAGHGIFDLDLTVQEGEVFGYLGPNGAGKTTTIKLLMGMIHATRGSATILGLDVDRDAVQLKHKIGYVPGELPQFGGWRGSEVVAYIAGLRGDVTDGEVEAVAKRLDLDLGRKYREYSTRQQAEAGAAPGVRAEARPADPRRTDQRARPTPSAGVLRIGARRSGAGATILISSHVLSEVEHVCDRVGIVREGHLATVGQLDQLAGMRAHRIEIVFAGPPPVERIRAIPGFEQLAVEDHRVSGMFRGEFEPLLAALASSRVTKFESREPSLEEIFLGFYRE